MRAGDVRLVRSIKDNRIPVRFSRIFNKCQRWSSPGSDTAADLAGEGPSSCYNVVEYLAGALENAPQGFPGIDMMLFDYLLGGCGITRFDGLGKGAVLALAVSQKGVCIFRERALSALDAAGIPWRVAYSSASLSGLRSAVRAGLAVTVLTPSMLEPQLHPFGAGERLPELRGVELALHRSPGRPSHPAQQLAMKLQEAPAVSREAPAGQ